MNDNELGALGSRYVIPGPQDLATIGFRARLQRERIELSLGDVALKAGVAVSEVQALEEGNEVSLKATLAIHEVVSYSGLGPSMFTIPRFRTMAEVVAHERRRLGLPALPPADRDDGGGGT